MLLLFMQKVAFVNFIDVTVHYSNEATNNDINCDYMPYQKKRGIISHAWSERGSLETGAISER